MALLIGSGLLLLGAGVTLVLVRARKKDRMVAAQDRELARQERIIQEYRIREQLGQDMHDDLGAGLTALKLRSELIGTMPMAPGDRQELGQLATMAGDLIASLRQIIWALDAEKGSLADLVAVELATTGPWPGLQLSPEQRRNLFLVVKEALHNVVKHARARNVRLAMHMDGPMLYIAFSDDGVGLPPEGERTAGNGLRNMQRRIEAFGGRFHLEKAVPRGTSVHACLPLGEQ
jgi:signal transduction histidine kinase